jgi:hypothetical protein
VSKGLSEPPWNVAFRFPTVVTIRPFKEADDVLRVGSPLAYDDAQDFPRLFFAVSSVLDLRLVLIGAFRLQGLETSAQPFDC